MKRKRRHLTAEFKAREISRSQQTAEVPCLTPAHLQFDYHLMERSPPLLSDQELKSGIMGGLTAARELEARFRQPLERFLVGMCDRGDGRSQERAVEIVGQILAECFVNSPSLLEKWQGSDNLEAFLRTSAVNRLKSWWTSSDKRRTDVNSESMSFIRAAASVDLPEPAEVKMAASALRAGVKAAEINCPDGMVFLRLKGLHGVDQRVISRCWGHHESQTSRRIKEAMELIRSHAGRFASANHTELSVEMLEKALHSDPSILLGRNGNSAPCEDVEILNSMASGRADEVTKQRSVDLMCENPAMLEMFARILDRASGHEPLVIRDPGLSGVSARLTECVRSSLEILQPHEAVGLITQEMAAFFTDTLEHVEADGGTLWVLKPGSAALEAVFNPLEPEIAGKRQPLVSGIISLVLATGEAACVSAVTNHLHHSPAIDVALGKSTRSMIAVPFVLEGNVRGVLTTVRLQRDNPFGVRETRIVTRHSTILADLMVRELIRRILA